MLEATLDLLAEAGMDGVNADAVTRRAGTGKAALYRRWSSMPTLINQAVSNCTLVPPVLITEELREDLAHLLLPCTRPLDRDERAAAALLGHARHRPELQDALDAAVVEPLSAVLEQLVAHHGAGGPDARQRSYRLLHLVVGALWWRRYVACSQALSPAEVTDLVDRVLAPIPRTR